MAPITAKWTKLVESDRLKRSSQSLAVVGPKVYIFGGEQIARQPVDSALDVIDLEEDSVSATTLPIPIEAPTPRVGTAIASFNDKIVLFSGRGGLAMAPLEEAGKVWIYHTQDNFWELVTPKYPDHIPQGRSYHAVASDHTNTVYLHSGCPESGRLADLWGWDFYARLWRQLSSAPGAERGGSSVACFECSYKGLPPSVGWVARMNGYNGKEEVGGAIDIYCPANGTWSTWDFEADGINGPQPRSVSTLLTVWISGKQCLLTMFGEGDPSALGHAGAGKMFSDVWVFDIEEKTWEKVTWQGEGPSPRGWFAADVVKLEGDTDAVVLHGGLGEDNERLGDLWYLEFA